MNGGREVVLRLVGLATASMMLSGFGQAQIRDQVVVNSDQEGVPGPIIRIYDRQLTELSATLLTSETTNSISETENWVAVTGDGVAWIPIDPLNKKKLVRIAPDGQLLPTVLLGDYPVAVIARIDGVNAPTRIPLTQPAPLYSVDLAGSIQWSNPSGPLSFTGGNYPDDLCVTTGGDLWLGGKTEGPCACNLVTSLVLRLDSAGNIATWIDLPFAGLPDPTPLGYMASAPDGALWAYVVDGDAVLHFYNVDAAGIHKDLQGFGSYNGTTARFHVDAAGDLWTVGPISEAGGGLLRKFSAQDGSLLAEHDLGGHIIGFALGAAGEDIFAVIGLGTPTQRALVRLNLITGMISSRQIDPPAYASGLGNGDPTGFIFANVVDQAGDNDGDGSTNRQEVLAGSSPYDSQSRPDGPKVYLSFLAGSNALALRFVDPDGLLDSVSGLDLSTLSLTIGPYGNVFWFLLPFATALDLSPDGTDATLTFGALPLPSNKKWEIEARVSDLTGAEGWDWQVTPPGKL